MSIVSTSIIKRPSHNGHNELKPGYVIRTEIK